MYDQRDDIQTFMLSLESKDNATILGTSQAELSVVPQHIFTQEEVLLKVLLSSLTVEIVSMQFYYL